MTIDDADLDALRKSVAGLLDRHCDSAAARAAMDADAPFDRPLWAAMAELGWCGLLVPGEYGGAAAGMAAAVVVLEGLGAHVAAAPYLTSAVLATQALARGRPEPAAEWLPRLAAGEAVAAVALTGYGGLLHVRGLHDSSC